MDQPTLRDLFDYADGDLIWRRKIAHKVVVGATAGAARPDGYRMVRAFGRRIYVHRAVWIWHHGTIPDGMEVDHIDRDPRNCRIENLRLRTHAGNLMNRTAQKNSRTGVRNVCVHSSGKFMVQVQPVGYCGLFDTLEEAAAAAAEARAKLHPEQ